MKGKDTCCFGSVRWKLFWTLASLVHMPSYSYNLLLWGYHCYWQESIGNVERGERGQRGSRKEIWTHLLSHKQQLLHPSQASTLWGTWWIWWLIGEYIAQIDEDWTQYLQFIALLHCLVSLLELLLSLLVHWWRLGHFQRKCNRKQAG